MKTTRHIRLARAVTPSEAAALNRYEINLLRIERQERAGQLRPAEVSDQWWSALLLLRRASNGTFQFDRYVETELTRRTQYRLEHYL